MSEDSGLIARGRPALFLDRDGVINVDHGYVHHIDQFDFIPGIFDLVRFAVGELRWPVVVTTNQSGIGRGYFDEAAFLSLNEWMCERFRAEQAPIAKVYHCPYHPVHGQGRYRLEHAWRKPNAGMFLQAAVDLDLDLSKSAAIGDRISDMQAAAGAGVPVRVRVDAHKTLPAPDAPAHIVVRDLSEALQALRACSVLPPSPQHARERSALSR